MTTVRRSSFSDDGFTFASVTIDYPTGKARPALRLLANVVLEILVTVKRRGDDK